MTGNGKEAEELILELEKIYKRDCWRNVKQLVIYEAEIKNRLSELLNENYSSCIFNNENKKRPSEELAMLNGLLDAGTIENGLKKIMKKLVCKDGTELSVQASKRRRFMV